MFLGLQDPDPLVRGMDLAPDLDLSIIYDFLSLENYVNVALKNNKQKLEGH